MLLQAVTQTVAVPFRSRPAVLIIIEFDVSDAVPDHTVDNLRQMIAHFVLSEIEKFTV